MAGISAYEKIILAATAGFVLFTGGWFLAGQSRAEPYQVTVSRQQEEPAPASETAPPEETDRPDSLLEGEVININTADVYELQRLPGIGEKRARAIADYREEHGPFRSVDELDNVDGIGEGILSGLRDYVTVGSQEPEE